MTSVPLPARDEAATAAAGRFPKLDSPRVFIAAPGDVAQLRDAIGGEIQKLKDRSTDSGATAYSWDIDRAEDGFDDWLPAQEQIPLPSDPLCRAVVCAFGERIGTPLPDGFPLAHIGDEGRAAAPGAPHLVHPWKPGAERDGGFALTGSIFEYLAAMHANALGAEPSGRGRPPLLLLFIGDRSILEAPDPFDAAWGNGRFKAFVKAKQGNREHLRWLEESYAPQVEQLRNFIRYVESRGRVVDKIFAREDDALETIAEWLSQHLDVAHPDDDRDPFKKLFAYDVDDASVFFGRRDWRDGALRTWRELWSEPARAPFFGIVGGSGVGKSSLLRAGLIGHLKSRRLEGHYVGVVVTRHELTQPEPDSGAVDAALVLRRVFNRARAAIHAASPDGKPAPEEFPLEKVAPEFQPREAATRLAAEVARLGPSCRLVIGFDQFEELLEVRADPANKALLEPLFRFVEASLEESGSRRIGIIYTIQTDRLPLLEQDPILGAFTASGDTKFVVFPKETLHEIICRPFEARGIFLQPTLERALRDRILDFAGDSDTVHGSLMPLVSVTLGRLYDFVEARFPGAARRRSKASAAAASPAKKTLVLTLEHFKDRTHLLDPRNAIADLAERAVSEARAKRHGLWNANAVTSLLPRLVRLRGSFHDRLEPVSCAMPDDRTRRQLVLELKQQRLLVQDSSGRVRLIHEAVLRHWPEAADWLETERGMLDVARLIAPRALEWDRNGRKPESLRDLGQRDVDEAAELLARWAGVLSERSADELEPEDRLLRDHCLARLGAFPQAERLAGKPGRPHFIIAAQYGDCDLIRAYLAMSEAHVDLTHPDGSDAVHLAAKLGRLPLLELLLSAKARCDRPELLGWQPIHFAATSGNADVVRALIAAGASPDAPGFGKRPPIVVAADYGHTHLCALLIDSYGVDPMSHDDEGFSALSAACFRANTETVVALLKRPGVDPVATSTGREMQAIHCAVASHSRETVAAVLADPRVDVDARTTDGVNALLSAASAGAADVVEVLLSVGRADPNAHQTVTPSRYTALQVAVGRNRRDVVERLLADPRTNPLELDGRGESALGIGRRHARHEILKLLLDDPRVVPTEVELDGWTPLLVAAAERHSDAVLRFLGGGASPAQALEDGTTLLQLALQARDTTLVDELLADPRVDRWTKNTEHRGPLHIAARQLGTQKVVDSLLSDPTVDDAKIREFSTVLAEVAGYPHLFSMFERLANDERFDVDARDARGRTALHAAAVSAHLPAIEKLLARGADLRARDDWGRSPLDLCPDAMRPALEARFADAEPASRAVFAVRDVPSPDDPFTRLDGDEKRALLDHLREAPVDGCTLSTATEAWASPLPFYADVTLVRVQDPRWRPGTLRLYYLRMASGQLVRLDGASAPIHDANEAAPIRVTDQNVLAYLDFFTFFVHGDEGPFYLVRRRDDPRLPEGFWDGSASSAELDAATGSKAPDVQSLFRPPSFHGRGPDGRFRTSGLVYYGSAVFFADFTLGSDGMIEMVGDAVLASLTVRLDAPIAPILGS